jgi:glycosyltransferase involved in cell wall biosynthesis
MISAVIITKNEERNIEECLKSLSWADEIVVVDDESSDRTISLARKYTDRIYFNRLENFASQRNFGLSKAKGDWVLFVDADERVSAHLATEIKAAVLTNEFEAYYVKRSDFAFGSWLKWGETASLEFIRLAKRNAGKWERPVHETWRVKGEVGHLKSPLLHFSHPSVGEFVETINHFTSLDAENYFKQGRKVPIWGMIVYPTAKFIQNYLIRQGYRDGRAGLVFAVLMSVNSFLIRAKLWSLWNTNRSASSG